MTSQPEAATEFAPAKINLFLHVGEKRADGFHELRSLVAFADVGDCISIEDASEPSLVVQGRFAEGLAGEADNLALRAVRALASRLGREPKVRLVLQKNLPVSSGIGGGSADAAATLRGLLRFWNASLAADEMLAIASALGSDVPVCLRSSTSWMEGRGERVVRAGAIPPMPMLLVNPRIAVPTARVFAALQTRTGTDGARPAHWGSPGELISFLRTTRNDLEAPARELAPVIDDVLDTLAAARGQVLTRMSGSGATCFALFEQKAHRDQAARMLGGQHPDWWIAASELSDSQPQ